MNKDPARKPRGAFFGRRQGHPLRAGQADLIKSLLPDLAVDLGTPAPRDLAAIFNIPVKTLRLEIGFGGGEHLLSEAHAHPSAGFIGCEVYLNGVAKMLAAIKAEELRNIRLHHGDALALLNWLPEGVLSRIDILYPDPWPKRRHWKRRFISDERVGELGRILRRGGELRFATDWPAYAEWALLRFIRSPLFQWTAERADDWRKPWRQFPGTRYEEKAKKEGRKPCYLTFLRV
ncbi:MAG TPA: tRNA (guanosine(46)-N7)-methyltransferase TrmB [Xanthobacteraceae bacterium]|nr:tRNA (guanosine(46)-N7)-methyltransferase TrmB [Xanthobacteraceae bacterium]